MVRALHEPVPRTVGALGGVADVQVGPWCRELSWGGGQREPERTSPIEDNSLSPRALEVPGESALLVLIRSAA